jgi:hypothetical protein
MDTVSDIVAALTARKQAAAIFSDKIGILHGI